MGYGAGAYCGQSFKPHVATQPLKDFIFWPSSVAENTKWKSEWEDVWAVTRIPLRKSWKTTTALQQALQLLFNSSGGWLN